jgi:hypothetical protein
MYKAHRIVLALYCLLIAYCFVWAPWCVVERHSAHQIAQKRRLGYGWLWAGPRVTEPVIDYDAIAKQSGGIDLSAGLLPKPQGDWFDQNAPQNSATQSSGKIPPPPDGSGIVSIPPPPSGFTVEVTPAPKGGFDPIAIGAKPVAQPTAPDTLPANFDKWDSAPALRPSQKAKSNGYAVTEADAQVATPDFTLIAMRLTVITAICAAATLLAGVKWKTSA